MRLKKKKNEPEVYTLSSRLLVLTLCSKGRDQVSPALTADVTWSLAWCGLHVMTQERRTGRCFCMNLRTLLRRLSAISHNVSFRNSLNMEAGKLSPFCACVSVFLSSEEYPCLFCHKAQSTAPTPVRESQSSLQCLFVGVLELKLRSSSFHTKCFSH